MKFLPFGETEEETGVIICGEIIEVAILAWQFWFWLLNFLLWIRAVALFTYIKDIIQLQTLLKQNKIITVTF